MANAYPRLLRATEVDRSAARSLQRRHRAGALVRIADGVYVDTAVWQSMSAIERHLALARALAPTVRPTAAFSHLTAAIALGWPLVGPPPARVHVTDAVTSRTEHRAHLVRHAGEPDLGPRPVSMGGVPITGPLRTAIDLAATLEPAVAAVAVDHAVRTRLVTIDDFVAALPGPRRRGSVRGRTVAEALDPLHESAGESYTAIRMVEIGLPRPVAQHEFRSADGRTDRVDFWFEELGVVVEFDGKQKYVDREVLGARSPDEALWHEKVREDRLRAFTAVRTVVRPTWWHLVDPDRLRALFRQHRVHF
ncbi:hypothetical protein JOE58_001427 [Curtobacterium luteum]|uniref:Transcriptional regulator, AbiEi antitoxin, Type IV TA system n=1 Tax=Curtobacterium luteum TaxID=33881 RepID=A0ABS2RT34_9MICO|nr:hypothetical protein [Curtobacterium luteum]MBM7802176.1 hypothetical protein [Curtobacterium luteum]NUU52282.1 hypothetical protein [Curtobacterium luteum]